MAREVRQFEVTVPAGTAVASPQTTDLAMPPRIVRHVTVRIPPGPRGEVGWALGAAGVAVLPWNAGEWIIGDDERIGWDLDGQIDSGAWQIIAYNTGTYDHHLYVTFLLDLVTEAQVAAPSTPVDVSAVYAAATSAAASAPSVPAAQLPSTALLPLPMPAYSVPAATTPASGGAGAAGTPAAAPTPTPTPASAPGPAQPTTAGAAPGTQPYANLFRAQPMTSPPSSRNLSAGAGPVLPWAWAIWYGFATTGQQSDLTYYSYMDYASFQRMQRQQPWLAAWFAQPENSPIVAQRGGSITGPAVNTAGGLYYPFANQPAGSAAARAGLTLVPSGTPALPPVGATGT